jgi:hypothetical protein
LIYALTRVPLAYMANGSGPEGSSQRAKREGKNDEFFAIRHSTAEYKLDEGIAQAENPEAAPKAKDQWFSSDLTPEGVVLAQEKAKEFFTKLNPSIDALFFVSSDLVRAAETAHIYMDVARELGFEVIRPSSLDRAETHPDPRNKAEELGEGYVRKIDALTLDHLENMLQEFVFKPTDYLAEVVKYPENVSLQTREKWAEARKIIEADNKGTWGANYAAHSEEIAKIFPNVKSAQQVYESKFLDLMRLVRFGQAKINKDNPEKNIKVLGFSHENSFLYFLNKEFGEPMANCEAIAFKVDADKDGRGRILATAKGKEIEVKL